MAYDGHRWPGNTGAVPVERRPRVADQSTRPNRGHSGSDEADDGGVPDLCFFTGTTSGTG
jgi:hypothetical protein